MAKAKFEIKNTSALAVSLLVIVFGVISALNDFSILTFGFSSQQMITSLLIVFATFEIGLKGFQSFKALPLIVGALVLFTAIPFVLGFFGIANSILTGIAGVTKLLLVITAVILAFTKE